jgi:hypothetical protein
MAGMVVVRQRDRVELQKPENPPWNYSPFWYRLDLFIPFVDLQAANIWMPKQDCRFTRLYVRLQKIFGWILIPICLAALTGIIKPSS